MTFQSQEGGLEAIRAFPPRRTGKVVARKPVSIKDVADEAGVSITTVSHVLSGHRPVNAQTAARVRSIVDRVGYVPASLARSLASGSTSVIGLLVPDISNTFFGEIAKGVEDAAHDLGYSVILCNTEFDSAREDHYLDLIRSRFIDAMVYSAGSPLSPGRLDALLGRFPIALVDESFDSLAGTLSARADHREGGRLIGEHLWEGGHRSALLLTGPAGLVSAIDRAAGFREAFGGRVLEIAGDFREETGHRVVQDTLRDNDYTAVVAANDLGAFGAMAALREAGLSVPQDISVVGFDDIRAARLAHPRLTSVHQPAYRIGHTAATELLRAVCIGAIPEPVQHILPVTLQIRDSTAAPGDRRG